jgi:tetratricopeptide (TPR) repeat protein
MNSVRISQSKNAEALELLKKSYALWKDAAYQDKPSYEFRHNTAKLFVELGEQRTAINIWEELLEEDDSIAEIHALLAYAYRSISTSAAKVCLTTAKQVLTPLTACLSPCHFMSTIVYVSID